ncbi:hypothetical protein [Aquimarina longa]|uniref:hypothetical protein n=1 Tax=Aquimarina longa TaxID=1080221 RepID=UPI0007827655|nr:hypothetical protein [Aquimarina longa]
MNTNTAKQVISSSQQETHPGYYLQINNQNCYYELEINELSSGEYYGEYPVYSIRVPLNLEILKSGEQSLSLKVFPYKGDTLSPKANLQMRLIKYADMTDLENEYGGSTVLWNWEMPEIGEQHLPLFAYDTIFKAEVPWEINTLDTKATDLSKIDRDKLLEEVIAEFTKIRASIINKTQDKETIMRGMKRSSVQVYSSEEEDLEVLEGMINLGDGKEPQPLENFEMRLYYHNRVVTLVKNDDKEPAIWFKHPETGARSWQPVYIYKDNTTGKWERW